MPGKKPTNILELKGSFKKDPQRKRTAEPEAIGEIGDPFDWLDDDVKACWVEICSLAHAGTLCAGDRLSMEYYATLLRDLRAVKFSAPAPMLIRFEAMLAKYGMTPADRSRVQVIKPKEKENPYAEFGT